MKAIVPSGVTRGSGNNHSGDPVERRKQEVICRQRAAISNETSVISLAHKLAVPF